MVKYNKRHSSSKKNKNNICLMTPKVYGKKSNANLKTRATLDSIEKSANNNYLNNVVGNIA